jgi:hypothetical protein
MPTVNGKEIKVCASQVFNAKFAGIEARLYVMLTLKVLSTHPVDMLVFEENKRVMTIRSAGYRLDTQELDEETILHETDSLPTDTFWFKIDDYGDHYVGTFLFPEEY